jgi:hypothetical protein
MVHRCITMALVGSVIYTQAGAVFQSFDGFKLQVDITKQTLVAVPVAGGIIHHRIRVRLGIVPSLVGPSGVPTRLITTEIIAGRIIHRQKRTGAKCRP